MPLHRRWWVNDPDCLLLREHNTHLSKIEVQTIATVIALSGGSLFISDHLPELSGERIEWLSRLLPLLPGSARALDWFERTYPKQLILALDGEIGKWHLAALLNWERAEHEYEFDLNDLGFEPGMAYHAFDFWNQRYHRIESRSPLAVSIPEHGVSLFALRPIRDRPQWIGDTFHISQGLVVSKWDIANGRLCAKIKLARRASGRVWLALPFAPLWVKLDGKLINYDTVAEEIYAFAIDVNQEAELQVCWAEGGNDR
jgi:alpha-galactosidase